MRSVILLVGGLLIGASAQRTGGPPGNEPFQPTRLDWAVVELQAQYGQTAMTHEDPVQVSWLNENDGATVTCLLVYPANYPAASLKTKRDTMAKVFDMYRRTRNWSWLRLKVEEAPLKDPWPTPDR